MTTKEYAKLAIKALEDKKAEDMLMQLGSMGVNIDRLTKMAESRNKKNA